MPFLYIYGKGFPARYSAKTEGDLGAVFAHRMGTSRVVHFKPQVGHPATQATVDSAIEYRFPVPTVTHERGKHGAFLLSLLHPRGVALHVPLL